MTSETVSRAFRRERWDSRLIGPADPTSVTDLPPDLPPADRPVGDAAPVRQMGELGQHELLNLHGRAHLLSFRGPTSLLCRGATASPFRAIHHEWPARPRHRCPTTIAVDHDIVVVINAWVPVRFGHRDDAGRELATPHRNRIRQPRRTTTARRAA